MFPTSDDGRDPEVDDLEDRPTPTSLRQDQILRFHVAMHDTASMRHLEGIVETETMIAFRAYSKQELEAGFELGLD